MVASRLRFYRDRIRVRRDTGNTRPSPVAMMPLKWRRVLLLAAVVSSPFIWGLAVFAPDERAEDAMAGRSLQPPRPSESPPPLHSASSTASAISATPTAFLGVLTNAADPAIRGVLAGSPAAEAGLRRGDLILEIGGHSVRTGADLKGGLRLFHAGDEITVRLARESHILDVRLVVGARRASAP
jgi:S1-C subfamily serine protease